MPKMVPTFLPLSSIKELFEDQSKHIVNPAMLHATTCLSNTDPRQAVMVCPPGSGKTTTFIIDLVWRIASLAKKKAKRKSQLFVFTSPDDTITQDVYSQLQAIFSNNDMWDLLDDLGLNFTGLYADPDQVKGRGLEIVCCTIHKATGKQHKHLKQFLITAIISDEVHRGLGSPDSENYLPDVGYNGKGFEAIWYWKCRELKYDMWFGLTGTPTHSQLYGTDNYITISKDMEKSDWRLPFFEEKIYVFDVFNWDNQIEAFFKEVSKRNAIGKYLKSKSDKFPKELPFLLETKITGMIRCGIETARVPGPYYVRSKWDELCEKYENTTFDYDGEQIPYYIGKCALMTSEEKTGGDNDGTVKMLNDENSDYIAAAVIYIGTVGINITNLGVISILPVVNNPGEVDNNLQQLIARMDRCKFVWRGSFANVVAKISDPELRKLCVDLAVNTSSKKCFAATGGLAVGAYVHVRDSHVLVENAKGFLLGLISVFREQNGNSSVSGKERDLAYKNARKDRCEFQGCNCYEELVENSVKGSKAERELAYQQILQVDHIDGNRENMVEENLITLCPNRHSIKTINNEDYLNKYELKIAA